MRDSRDDGQRQYQPRPLSWSGVFWAVLLANMVTLAVVVALLVILGIVGFFQAARHMG
ncbi:hypothetical protein [Zavarzinella formosa]|uniref:hypothetical protein n=1 Tax=Zavarzinella formosa TaxID=360055 RepID=UPI00030C1775|nr:hypothetical protein [Zavarzinella formosa]